MRYLVTGGAGFVGSNLVDRLIDDGHDVVIVDNLSTGDRKNINPKAEFWKVDITDVNEDWEEIFVDIDTVFHTAAMARVQPSIDDPVAFDKVNVGGTLNMLKVSYDNGVRRFVYSASSSAYGDTDNLPQKESHSTDPISPYAVQKMVGEIYCTMFPKVYNMETVSLRYFNVYGERQSFEGAYALVMGVFANQLLSGKPMTINGDGEQRRDFTYVGDVVDANIRAATSDKVGNGEVINIGNGDNKSVNELADLLGGERIHREPVIEPFATLADNTKAKELLGWKPKQDFNEWVTNWKKELGL
jgi:UDP-glucose 4-epimerase|tara:strand:- start:1588 stop:2490 length:903 start_codon:yes stop_codon:yes gene_type:complete